MEAIGWGIVFGCLGGVGGFALHERWKRWKWERVWKKTCDQAEIRVEHNVRNVKRKGRFFDQDEET